MKEMSRYCKAYLVKDLRRFPEWERHAAPKQSASGADDEAGTTRWSDEDFLFLQEDYSVTNGIFLGENVVFDRITDVWKQFCQDRLKFSPHRFPPASATQSDTTEPGTPSATAANPQRDVSSG